MSLLQLHSLNGALPPIKQLTTIYIKNIFNTLYKICFLDAILHKTLWYKRAIGPSEVQHHFSPYHILHYT